MVEATHRLGVLMLTSDPIEYEKALPKGNGGRRTEDRENTMCNETATHRTLWIIASYIGELRFLLLGTGALHGHTGWSWNYAIEWELG
jgi:hypothetical protein